LQKLEVNEVSCKTVLHEMEGTGEYTANFYRGCSHGCVYCYAPSLVHAERPWGSFVDVKVNAAEVLRRELSKARRGVVFLSSASDPYQPVEAKYRLTRMALEALLRKDFPVIILTRSPLVLRDLDLLKRFRWLRIGFSISSVPGKLYEPGVAPVERRIETLRALGEAGIKTWVSMAPLIPQKMDIDVRELLGKLKAAGVSSVSAGILRFNGYQESKEMFEKVSGTDTLELTVGAEETISAVRKMVGELGFEGRDSFFEWHPQGGMDEFLPETSLVPAQPIN
jgi:DNA repair photolyase